MDFSVTHISSHPSFSQQPAAVQSLSKWVRNEMVHYHDPVQVMQGIADFLADMQGK